MKTKDWYSWINLMPPKPDDFHVIGEVYVANPGVKAMLCTREPQGINPEILLLDLHLIQEPGMWAQVMTWTQAKYDKVLTPKSPRYRQVDIFFNNEPIAQTNVEEIH
ncbi:hypothetical protein [Zooshikella sp. RANM57]|uniref:hypothetical protein n=1 Tax=Zooshikella sp. RANM57 TaxID=3425863 RepID=UPI003D6FDBCC